MSGRESATERPRCAWATSPEMIHYHDHEWGIPEHDERMLFELLTLEGAQAGLSWQTILKRRANYCRAFANFDLETVAAFDDGKIAECLADSGIIRNRAKILSTVGNAKAILALQKHYGSFDAYMWKFTDGRSVVSRRGDHEALPAFTPLSALISKDLKAHGFNFVGPTIVYSFLQAIGVIDDHYASCFRGAGLSGLDLEPCPNPGDLPL